MSKKDYPLVVLRQFSELKKQCDLIAKENIEIINYAYIDEPMSIRFSDKEQGSKFFIEVSNPKLEDASKGKPSATLIYYPQTQNLLKEYTRSQHIELIPDGINRWVDYIKKYNMISLKDEDQFVKKYTTDFYLQYKITEEDADTMPFNMDQQKKFIYLLEFIKEKALESEDQDTKTIEIIQDSAYLTNSIQKLTKNQFLLAYSYLRAKIYIKGEAFSKYVWGKAGDEFTKYLLKKGLEFALETAKHFIGNL